MKTGGSILERSIVFKDRPRLRGLLRGIFEKQRTLKMCVGQVRLAGRDTSALPIRVLLSRTAGLRVCDGARRLFVMKGQLPVQVLNGRQFSRRFRVSGLLNVQEIPSFTRRWNPRSRKTRDLGHATLRDSRSPLTVSSRSLE